MKNFFKNKLMKRALLGGLLAVLVIGGVFVYKAMAVGDATITAATGATSVSIDTTTSPGGSSTWTGLGTISGPVINENTVGNISTGLHTLTLPAGWEFNTGQNVTIGLNGTELTLGASVITPGATTLVFNITAVSTSVPAVLTFSNIQVRPTGTTVSTGNMTMTAGAITGVNGSTNFGTFSTVHGAATKYVIIDPTDGTVDAPVTVTVQLQDQFGNLVNTGADTDKDVTLAANGSATGGGVVNIASGTGTKAISDTVAETVNLSLNTPVLATADVSSTQNVVYAPGVATHLSVTAITDPVVAGTASDVTVTARDANENVATSYVGTVHFTSTDVGGSTILPGDYTFLVEDNGVKTFTGEVTLTTIGERTVTATDTVTGSINGTQAAISVTHAAANKYVITEPVDGTVDADITVTVQLQDVYGNIVTTGGDKDDDVTLNATGSVTGDGLVNIADGTGSLNINDHVAETVIFTLADAGAGFIATDTKNVVYAHGVATKVIVETLANGTGVVVPVQDVTTTPVVGYSITRDQYDNFVANAAAVWSLAGSTGGVVNGDLVAAGDNLSATFTGAKVGTTAIHAVVAALATTDSGTLTVKLHNLLAPTAAAAGDGYINDTEENAGFTVRATLDGAIATNDIELLVGGASFGAPKTHTLDAGDITAGFYDFTVSTGDLGTDASKSLTAKITNGADIQTSPALVFTLDTAAPAAPSITSIGSTGAQGTGNYINSSNQAAIHVTGTAEADSTINVSLISVATVTGSGTATGGNFDITIDATGLADGTVTPSVTATDAAGNISAPDATPTATKDVVNPTAPTAVTFTATGGTAVANYVNTTNTNFTGGATITIAEATGGAAHWFIDGTTFPTSLNDTTIGGGETSVAFDAGLAGNGAVQGQIPSGAHQLSVQLCDAANNCVTSIVGGNKNITADYAVPVISSVALGTNEYVNTAEEAAGVDIVVNTTGAEDGQLMTCTVKDVGNTNTVSPAAVAVLTNTVTISTGSLAALNDGVITAYCNVSDLAGNPAVEATDTSTLDSAAPAAPSITQIGAVGNYINSSNQAAIHVTGTAEADSTINVSLTSVATVTGSGTATGGNFDITIDATGLADGTVTPSVTATDAAGNVSAADATPTALKDIIAPTAPTAVTFTAVGGTVVADYVNNTNTNFTGGATIVAGEATDGSANWYIGGVAFATPINDATILVGDTSVVFNAGLALNADVQNQIAAGSKTLSVRLCDAAGNCTESSAGNKTIVADYTNPASAATIANTLYGSTTYIANTVNGTASDAGGAGVASVTITIQESDSNKYWDGDSWEVGVTNLPVVGTTAWTYNSGTAITHTDTRVYTVTPTATDTAGNSVAGTADTYTWDGTIPTITSYNSDKPDGSYKAGVVVDVDVTFSEAVTTASSITLTMDTGGTCVIAPFVNSATATCDYTVAADQTSADLTVSTFSAAGAVTDQAGNIMVSFTPTGNNLAANKAIIIDTTAPSVTMGTNPGTKTVTWTQNTTVTDTNMAGIVYAWTAPLAPYAVTFETSNAEDTTISAGGIGYYTVQLTATDLAGNVGTGSISFTWNALNVPIASYSPINGATGVAVAAGNASITFAPIGGVENITLIDAAKVTIVKDSDGSDVANGAVSVSGGNNTSKILLVPHDALENNTVYRINILSGAVRDATGHINSEGVSYFTTVATAVTPTVTLDGAAIVSAYSASEANTRFTSDLTFTLTNDASVTVNGATVAAVGHVVTAASNAQAKTLGAHTYNVVVTSSTGHTAETTVSYQVTADPAETTPPTVDLQSPLDNSTSTAITVSPTVRFDEAMDSATVNTNTVQLRVYIGDAIINSSVTYDAATHIATIDPVANLTNATQYYIWVSGAKDVAGNTVTAYTTKAAQEFTTVAAGTGSFGIISTTMTKMTGTADGTYANGWEWVVRLTLPTNQNDMALKFNNWVSGSNSLPVADNMEYYSEQIAAGTGSAASPVSITAANTYPSNFAVSTDVDPNTDGIQTDIHVKVKIPAATAAGSYSTSYRVNYE